MRYYDKRFIKLRSEIKALMLMHWRAKYSPLELQLLNDDINFVTGLLINKPKNLHKSFISNYLEKWSIGIGMTEISPLQQNKGRFMANSYLRESLIENK